MSKSNAVACWKPSNFKVNLVSLEWENVFSLYVCLVPNFKSKSCIFGMRKGFLSICFFSSLKSEMKRTVPYFLGMIKVGAGHSELFIFLSTPTLQSRMTSSRKGFSYARGTGKGLA